jgi:Uma2 family endonuclease
MLQTPARALSRVEVVERLTAADFFRRAPEDRKAELIDGVMIMPSPPSDTHERLVGFLFTLLRMYVEEHNLGEVRGSHTAVKLADDQAPEPDVLFVAREREHIITDEGVFGAPDLVIEVLSASTAANDRGPKFRAYEYAGVREVWLIDPYGPAGTEFYQRVGNGLRPVMPNAEGVVEPLALPGFRLRVTWLWPPEKFIAIHEALNEMSR